MTDFFDENEIQSPIRKSKRGRSKSQPDLKYYENLDESDWDWEEDEEEVKPKKKATKKKTTKKGKQRKPLQDVTDEDNIQGIVILHHKISISL